jgi:hypothetical protein
MRPSARRHVYRREAEHGLRRHRADQMSRQSERRHRPVAWRSAMALRLRSSGGDCWKGRCPLPGHPHPEGASSSFKVYRQGGWECSGCGLAGPDGISLEQAITDLDFPPPSRLSPKPANPNAADPRGTQRALAACLRIALHEPSSPRPHPPSRSPASTASTSPEKT